VNVFHRGFVACDTYANGEQAVREVTAPILFALGTQDQMTPARAANSLTQAARASGKVVQVVHLPMGHHQMTETPEELLAALRRFLSPT